MAEEIIPGKGRRSRQKWITDNILDLMEENKDTQVMYERVKELTGERRLRTG